MMTELLRALLTVAALAGSVADACAAVPGDPDAGSDPDDRLEGEVTAGFSAWPGGLDAFADRPYDVDEDRGLVEAVDPAGPVIVIDGLRFGFVLEPEIRLRAGAGAPTLLRPGMVLEYYFTEVPSEEGSAGRIVAAIELDPSLAEPE